MTDPNHPAWNHDDDQFLIDAVLSGTDPVDIAVALGRTAHAIRCRIRHALGVPPRTVNSWDAPDMLRDAIGEDPEFPWRRHLARYDSRVITPNRRLSPTG